MKLLNTLNSAIIFFSICNSTFSQVSQEWVQRYNGPGNQNDNAYAIALDDSGNVYVTGQSPGIDTYDDYATIKYNSSGIQQWIAIYDGPVRGNDAAFSIAIDTYGNIYVTGESYGGLSDYDYDFATIKYNSSGIEQWVARYGGPSNDFDAATAMVIDKSGNVYVTGLCFANTTVYDYLTIKYNSSGVQLWTASYNGPYDSDDISYSIGVDNYGNVYVSGQCTADQDNNDFATVKYDSNGIQKWVTLYNGPYGPNNDFATALALDTIGNVYVTGPSTGPLNNYWDYATIKYNSSGVQQWVKRFNGPGNGTDWPHSLKLDDSGNVIVTGISLGLSGINSDFATIKYSSTGVQQWIQRYNGPGNGNDEARSVSVDSAGNVYVSGFSTGNGTGVDYATIKYNSSGVQQWLQRYNGPANGDDYAYEMTVDQSGSVYVTGGSGPNYDYATIKYSSPVTILTTAEIIPGNFSLSQNYPNPFNPVTNLEFGISELGFVSLKVYDLLGNEVRTLVNENKSAGIYTVEFDGSDLSSGIYFYKLTSGRYSDTKRMILLK